MIFTRHFFIRIIIVVKLNYVVGEMLTQVYDPMDWRVVESLAEQYPYVIALLNLTKDYMCTGVIVNKRTVLTAGSCIDPELRYIAVGYAVLSKSITTKSLFGISSMSLHGDYLFELKAPDPNVTQMHSNIGLVFSARPNLETYIPSADLGNYFAPELQQKKLIVIGYGKINGTNLAVLQQQLYHQTPCTNPKWYYCVCGFELRADRKTYIQEFGQGAPVLLGSDVVGVAAAPCGSLELSTMMVKYNIFTVLGPYLPWIAKLHSNYTVRFRATSGVRKPKSLHSFCILLLFVKVLFY